jgi:hypothetical protein
MTMCLTRGSTRTADSVNNYLLPLWMIIFGVALLRHSPAILIRQPI